MSSSTASRPERRTPLRGRDGRDGRPGRNGIDGKDGRDGSDGRPGRDGKDGKAGERGPRGERGERGPQGPVGPMPAHRWIDGTKLQLEQAPGGVWGDAVDLKGEPGKPGRDGVGGGVVVQQGGGTGSGNGYFPGGWV